jgi:hypothetical protein
VRYVRRRPRRIALEERDEHLLAQARMKLYAETIACPVLRDAHPAAVLAGPVGSPTTTALCTLGIVGFGVLGIGKNGILRRSTIRS